MGGGWSGWSLPSLSFDMNMYVKTLMFIVEDGSISRSKNKRMLTLSTYHENGLFSSVLSPVFVQFFLNNFFDITRTYYCPRRRAV